MGSRYGGLKQLDGVGPSGETIMDYSVFDAARAGFGKVVFVIGRHFERDFREKVLAKYEGRIPTEVVFQSVDALPDGFVPPADRVKPWGTGHAVLTAAGTVREPFAVINADDFYGRNGFEVLARFLAGTDGTGQYCMVGYRVGNTLSESGSVSRGVCETDTDGFLTSVTERTEIRRQEGRGIIFRDEQDEYHALAPETPVSMNMWGFTPDYFRYSEEYFKELLRANIDNPKAEYYIPLMVNKLITEGTATVEVLDTTAKWFGVTYAADRQGVVDKIRALVDAGEYPAKLF